MYAGTPAAMRAFFCGLQKQFPVEHCAKSPQDGSLRAEVARFIPLSPDCPALRGETRIMLYIRKGDITWFSGDVIVNAASARLHHGGGVCGAIYRAAGPELLTACRTHIRHHGNLPVGTAVLTPPGKLPCRGVIHAVGPRWLFGVYAERQDGLLAQAYRRALQLARDRLSFTALIVPVFVYKSAKRLLSEC
ncbi:hypothetical protein FHI53_26965 [Salmonella enterica]|nr:hypothetical protein [Salmonella enterica]